MKTVFQCVVLWGMLLNGSRASETQFQPGNGNVGHAVPPPEIRMAIRTKQKWKVTTLEWIITPQFSSPPPENARIVTYEGASDWTAWNDRLPPQFGVALYRTEDSEWGPGFLQLDAEYKIVASPIFAGTKITWREFYGPDGNPSGETETERSWTVGANQSPTYSLSTSTDGSYAIDPFTLEFPVKLTVDANCDETVDDTGASDSATEERPFRFWLNDDNDRAVLHTWTNGSTFTELEQDDEAVSNDSDKNCYDVVINGERDLEDLARLWISTSGLNASFKSGDLQLGLKWTDISDGDPAIRLFHAVEANGGNGYLFNPSTATAQVDQTAATGAHGLAVGSVIQGTDPVILPQSLFADLTEAQPKTYLLFEGVEAGKGQLKLVILDKNGTPIGEGPGVWMELKEPGDFVERYTCGDQSMGTVGALTHYPQTATFGAPTTEDEKDYVLYVHGYNMEDPLKQRWIETTYKRLYWLGYKGRVGGFSWPCAYGLVDQIYFDDSENRAWQAAVRLKEHLVNLKNLGYRVHVIAHSQGNVVMGEALRLWRADGQSTPLVSSYIASQAAIAAHCYNATAPLMPNYEEDTPNVYASYWSAGDSPRFPQAWPASNPPYLDASFMQSAASRWLNFYNPQDYALTAANGGYGSWEKDQRWKPDNGYSWSVTNGFFKGLVPLETDYSFPDDRYTIFSYCAEARSVALGTNATGGVFGGAGLDLEAQVGYSRAHLWHSAQFRSFMAARYQYWAELMQRIGIQSYTP